MKDNIKILKIHICSFEKSNDINFKFNKYDARLFVVDKNKDIAIEVETLYQYPYVRTDSMLYFLNDVEARNLLNGKRAACFEYPEVSLIDLDSETLNRCKQIIDSLKKDEKFLDGNEELTNERFLELLNNKKTKNQSNVKCKNRKKRK